MVELLSVKVKPNEVDKLAQECIQELTKDGKITKSKFYSINTLQAFNYFQFKLNKDEFVKGLAKNFTLRSIMVPFN